MPTPPTAFVAMLRSPIMHSRTGRGALPRVQSGWAFASRPPPAKAVIQDSLKILRIKPSENGILRVQTENQEMAFNKTKDRLEYFVACVTEFADAFGLDYQKSFDYLDKHCGMDFLMKCYEAEHTVSFADAVNDLQRVCRRNGGRI